MITRVTGCLKDLCDSHQECPRRVSCILLLKKKVTLQKHDVLKVKSFALYPFLSIEQKVSRLWLLKAA